MTPHQAKAREIRIKIQRDSILTVEVEAILVDLIEEAEAKGRDAGLEEAAKIAKFDATIGGNYENGCCRYSSNMIAKAIRKRKGKGV